MKRAICSLGSVLVLAATTAAAQVPPTTIAVSIQRAYAGIKGNLTQAAEKMPEADYNFKPSAMPECGCTVRSFLTSRKRSSAPARG